MSTFLKILIAACLVGAVLIARQLDTSTDMTYDIAPQKVMDTLVTTGLPPMVFGSDPKFQRNSPAPGLIEWKVSSDGPRKLRLQAQVKPVSATRTTVVVSVLEPTADELKKAGVGGAGALLEMYRVAMAEKIDATLTNRPFNISKTYPAMQEATVANFAAIARDLDDFSKKKAREDDANIAQAYEDEAAGRPPRRGWAQELGPHPHNPAQQRR